LPPVAQKICADILKRLDANPELDPKQHRLVYIEKCTPTAVSIWLSCYTRSIFLADFRRVQQDVLLDAWDVIESHGARLASELVREIRVSTGERISDSAASQSDTAGHMDLLQKESLKLQQQHRDLQTLITSLTAASATKPRVEPSTPSAAIPSSSKPTPTVGSSDLKQSVPSGAGSTSDSQTPSNGAGVGVSGAGVRDENSGRKITIIGPNTTSGTSGGASPSNAASTSAPGAGGNGEDSSGTQSTLPRPAEVRILKAELSEVPPDFSASSAPQAVPAPSREVPKATAEDAQSGARNSAEDSRRPPIDGGSGAASPAPGLPLYGFSREKIAKAEVELLWFPFRFREPRPRDLGDRSRLQWPLTLRNRTVRSLPKIRHEILTAGEKGRVLLTLLHPLTEHPQLQRFGFSRAKTQLVNPYGT